MPAYEYECVACSIKVTLERSIHTEGAPMCCNESMRQVYYAPAIQLKGKGWGKDAQTNEGNMSNYQPALQGWTTH